MKEPRQPLNESALAALLASGAAGLYLSVFYTLNNLTLLRGGGIILLFGVLVVPLSVSTLVAYSILHAAGRDGWARAAVAFMISAFLLLMLRPSLVEFDLVDGFFRAFPAHLGGLASGLFVIAPAALLALVFRRRLTEYAAILGLMTVVALALGASKITAQGSATEAGRRLDPRLRAVVLAQKPDIYFILADAYGSLAYMEEHSIDVSELTDFLSHRGFRLYEDTYSNYQPTTSALPAMLNMEHHYYGLTGHNVNFTEVDRASRRIIGGDNAVSDILRGNGYEIQYIHNGTYLLLQGCSADVCFPEIDGLAGARIILSNMLKRDLLADEDKIWETTTLEEMSAEVASLMADPGTAPRFQYIHAFKPGHPPGAGGRCDETQALEKYAQRLRSAGAFLRRLIGSIIERDPTAVIVLAGDHGPLLAHGCSSNAYIDRVAEYRDRAGALMAIRWPASYDGRYDERIVTGVNLWRYVLAALAADPTPLLATAADDDVFVRAGGKIFKVLADGKALEPPQLAASRRRAER
jgi:hypothetical protein